MDGEALRVIGIVLMSSAVIIGIIAAVVLRISGKRLKSQLDAEFGKRQG